MGQFGSMPLQLLVMGLLQYLLGLLQFFDVDSAAEPIGDLAVLIPHGDGPAQVPAVAAVRCPPQPVFEFVGHSLVGRVQDVLDDAEQVVGMHRGQPTVIVRLCGRLARVFVPARLAIHLLAAVAGAQASRGIDSTRIR